MNLLRTPARRRLAAVVAAFAVGLVVLSGCGAVRRGGSVSAPAPTVATVPATAPTTAPAAAAADRKDLDQLDQQLAGVNADLQAVNGDLQTADQAISSQEGDPSK